MMKPLYLCFIFILWKSKTLAQSSMDFETRVLKGKTESERVRILAGSGKTGGSGAGNNKQRSHRTRSRSKGGKEGLGAWNDALYPEYLNVLNTETVGSYIYVGGNVKSSIYNGDRNYVLCFNHTTGQLKWAWEGPYWGEYWSPARTQLSQRWPDSVFIGNPTPTQTVSTNEGNTTES